MGGRRWLGVWARRGRERACRGSRRLRLREVSSFPAPSWLQRCVAMAAILQPLLARHGNTIHSAPNATHRRQGAPAAGVAHPCRPCAGWLGALRRARSACSHCWRCLPVDGGQADRSRCGRGRRQPAAAANRPGRLGRSFARHGATWRSLQHPAAGCQSVGHKDGPQSRPALGHTRAEPLRVGAHLWLQVHVHECYRAQRERRQSCERGRRTVAELGSGLAGPARFHGTVTPLICSTGRPEPPEGPHRRTRRPRPHLLQALERPKAS